MKYLGLVLDSRWNFEEHFRRLAPKLNRTGAAFKRLLPNLGGPGASCRELYADVVRSMAGPSLFAGLPPCDLEATVYAHMHDLRLEMQRRGETPLPRQVAAWQTELWRVLVMAKWRQRLSQPNAGHAIITALSSLFETWLERPHGVLTFRMTQILTGHGKFGRFLHQIREEPTPGCRHSVDRPEDTLEHTVEVCPAWEEHRRVLVGAIGGGDLSWRALVEAMVRGEEEWQAVASFCKAVMLAKEVDRIRQRQRHSRRSRRHRDSDPDFRPP